MLCHVTPTSVRARPSASRGVAVNRTLSPASNWGAAALTSTLTTARLSPVGSSEQAARASNAMNAIKNRKPHCIPCRDVSNRDESNRLLILAPGRERRGKDETRGLRGGSFRRYFADNASA